MGNGSSQEGEFQEGMTEISDRGFGSYRLVSMRDIFKKPLLTSSESSSTTTSEDLAERCPCKCHEKQRTLENGVEHCCRCHRPKITEPADGCSCQCHKAQEQPKKCCACRTLVNTTDSPGDNQSEKAPSEKSAGDSPGDNQSEKSPSEKSAGRSSESRSNFQAIVGWFYQTDTGESPNNSDETPLNPPRESTRRSTGDDKPEQVSPEESTSDSSTNPWGLPTFTSWFFQSSPEELQNNPSAANQAEEASEEMSSNSSWDNLSQPAPSEKSPENPSTTTWWDFQMISCWLHQTTSAEAQSGSDDNLPQQTSTDIHSKQQHIDNIVTVKNMIKYCTE